MRILTGQDIGPDGDKRDYIKTKEYPEKLPERLLRDRLAAWLKSNVVAPRKVVESEYTVGGIDG